MHGSFRTFCWDESGAASADWVLVAAILLLVSIALWHRPVLLELQAVLADHHTAVGERRVISLPDGSTLHLNTASAANVQISGASRAITLIRGEAAFTVAADPARPFIVTSGPVTARALGTAFTVRRDRNGQVTVTVLEHAVEVASTTRGAVIRATVQAGEQVGYSPAHGFGPVQAVNLRTVAAWQRGKLIFDSRPLWAVVDELNRYRPGRIVIMNPQLRALRVTGVFSLTETEDPLRVIQDTLPVNTTRLTPYLVLLY